MRIPGIIKKGIGKSLGNIKVPNEFFFFFGLLLKIAFLLMRKEQGGALDKIDLAHFFIMSWRISYMCIEIA